VHVNLPEKWSARVARAVEKPIDSSSSSNFLSTSGTTNSVFYNIKSKSIMNKSDTQTETKITTKLIKKKSPPSF
jgi:hypothetical protein